MDQVISLVGRFLDLFPHMPGSDPIITPSTINNYVRMKIMPAPVKKKYTKIHLAYLIMICTLKQSLSISVVSKIIPMNIPEEEVKEIYDDFVMRHRSLCRLCTEQVKQLAADVFDPNRRDDSSVKHLVVESAIYSHLYKLLTEKIVALSTNPSPSLRRGRCRSGSAYSSLPGREQIRIIIPSAMHSGSILFSYYLILVLAGEA